MKKMKLTWRCLMATLIFIPLIQACDWLDDDDDWANKMTIVTIKAVNDTENNDEFYFLIDGGKKMYADTKRYSSNYDFKDGQRAFVYINLLSEEIPGYDYNAELVYIENILTKNVIDLNEEIVDSIGNDKINITYAWYGGDHVNIQFEFFGTTNPKELHMVNLVRNEMEEIQEEGDYLIVEFRHNAHNDYPNERLTGIASFRPPFAKDDTKQYKGLMIRTNTIYGGIQTTTVRFDNQESRNFSGTTIGVQ